MRRAVAAVRVGGMADTPRLAAISLFQEVAAEELSSVTRIFPPEAAEVLMKTVQTLPHTQAVVRLHLVEALQVHLAVSLDIPVVVD
jgi:hypothetical protein